MLQWRIVDRDRPNEQHGYSLEFEEGLLIRNFQNITLPKTNIAPKNGGFQ